MKNMLDGHTDRPVTIHLEDIGHVGAPLEDDGIVRR